MCKIIIISVILIGFIVYFQVIERLRLNHEDGWYGDPIAMLYDIITFILIMFLWELWYGFMKGV